MTRKTDAAVELTDPTPEQVLRFLELNPRFLAENADLMDRLAAPKRDLGQGVHDLQEVMIGKLRRRIEETEEVARILIDTSRDNQSTQVRIHECVLALLDAASFEQLIQIATVDLAVLLDVDAVTLCIESEESGALPLRALQLLPEGAVAAHIGAGRSVVLDSNVSADPAVFGAAAPLIRSQALVRLRISDSTPDAMLAFGSRDEERFHTGQATELLQFLGQVLEKLIRVWLELPE